MTKQEEIRKKIRSIIDSSSYTTLMKDEKIWNYLHSVGVVIKVESNNVPDKCLCNMVEGRGYPNCGVVVVKSLI